MENNQKQNIAIAEINRDLSWLKNEFASIKHIVSNDLPHQIQELRKDLNNYKSTQSKWMVGTLVTLLFLLIGVIANLIR